MIKTTLTAISALVLVAAATNLARADSLNDTLSREDLVNICATLDIGAEITGDFVLLDGVTVVTGKVECEAEDLVLGADDSSELSSMEDDDISGVSSEIEDENEIEDESEDLNSGSNSGSGDDGEDDHSGEGGGDDE